MKWSWKIGRFAGIDVYIHATFILLVVWMTFTYWLQTRTLNGTLAGIGFLLALFLLVVMHEYGHALTARRYGIKTRDITLLPIGGLARLERMPENPLQELWVALAGPAVNLVIAALLVIWLILTNSIASLTWLGLDTESFIGRLLLINLILAGFNLIPAFPMDGGRMLRALLAIRLEYTRATQIAATIGQGLAFLFGFAGLFFNPFLVFIALFVYIGAAQEASMVQMKSALAGIPVGRAMLTNFASLSPRDDLSRAVQLILNGSQQDFPVIEQDRVVGILLRKDLMTALARSGQSALVAEVMLRDFEKVEVGDMLEPIFVRLQACDCHVFPVLQNDRIVGLLTMDNIGEFMMIQSALGQRPLQRLIQ